MRLVKPKIFCLFYEYFLTGSNREAYLLSLQLVLCRVAAIKSLPVLIFSAEYILLLVL